MLLDLEELLAKPVPEVLFESDAVFRNPRVRDHIPQLQSAERGNSLPHIAAGLLRRRGAVIQVTAKEKSPENFVIRGPFSFRWQAQDPWGRLDQP